MLILIPSATLTVSVVIATVAAVVVIVVITRIAVNEAKRKAWMLSQKQQRPSPLSESHTPQPPQPNDVATMQMIKKMPKRKDIKVRMVNPELSTLVNQMIKTHLESIGKSVYVIFSPSISILRDERTAAIALRVLTPNAKGEDDDPNNISGGDKYWNCIGGMRWDLVDSIPVVIDQITITSDATSPIVFNDMSSNTPLLPRLSLVTPETIFTAATPVPPHIPPPPPGSHRHNGIEDARVFFRRTRPGAHTVGNIVGVSITIRRIVITDPDGVQRPLPTMSKDSSFEKNWMPVIDRDGFLIEPIDGYGLFMYAFAPSSFVVAPVVPDANEPTRFVATLNSCAPNALNGIHLCTPLVWSSRAAGFICGVHIRYDWSKFAFAIFNPDGPNGAPGSRRGITALTSIPPSMFGTKWPSERDKCPKVICYPTSIAENPHDASLILGMSLADCSFAFVAIDPDVIVVEPRTGAPSPWASDDVAI